MRTLLASNPSKSEILARRFLDGARDRALLRDGQPTIYIRVLRFVDILRSAPTLIRYEPDYRASVPGWPRFAPHYSDCRIIVTDEVIHAR